jgi:hypothetical protein
MACRPVPQAPGIATAAAPSTSDRDAGSAVHPRSHSNNSGSASCTRVTTDRVTVIAVIAAASTKHQPARRGVRIVDGVR